MKKFKDFLIPITLIALLICNYFSLYKASAFLFCLGFIIYFVSLITWQKEKESLHRRKSAVFSIMIFYILTVILLFAGGFQIASHFGDSICYNTNASGSEIKHFFDFLYYSAITATSLGFGDMVPHCDASYTKALTILEVIFGPLFIIAIISMHLTDFKCFAKKESPVPIQKNIFDDA